MIALHESLVEWTVLALGFAVAAALLLRRRGVARWLLRQAPRWPRLWLPGVALVVIVANAGIAVNAAAGTVIGQHAGSGAAAVRLGAIAASACLAALLAAWLYLNRRLRMPPSAEQDEKAGGEAACPHCMHGVSPLPAAPPNRRRARGLTMTRLGGG